MNATHMMELLSQTADCGASDLHLSAGLVPMMRRHGDLHPLPHAPCSHEQVLQFLQHLMTPEQRHQYESQLECDFAYEHPPIGRFRVNAFVQHRGAAAALRAMPPAIPRLSELRAPQILDSLLQKTHGLILVTGATGCGKSTTLAAMVDHINRHQQGHILTIEDPIEYLHRPDQCLINQREVGNHTHHFAAALKSALREDPDVIVVGEMRDLESIRLALTAAETGHLVLATLHTPEAAQSIHRLVDIFPPGEKDMIRAMVADCLLAVVAQHLCKTIDGQQRVAAFEVLVANHAVRHLIREGKTSQIYSTMQSHAQAGMKTMDQSLNELRQAGLISLEEMQRKARHSSP